jgi:hypothetical protein
MKESNDGVGVKNLLNHIKGMTDKGIQQTGRLQVSQRMTYKGLYLESLSTGILQPLIVIGSISFYEARGQITEYSAISGTIPSN